MQLVETLRCKLEGAGSIPDGVIGIFHWHNPSSSTVVLGSKSTSNRNKYQEYFLGGKGGRWGRITSLRHSCDECLEIRKPQPIGTLRVCRGSDFVFTFIWQFWDCEIFTVCICLPANLLPKEWFFSKFKEKIDPNYIYGSTSRRPLNFLSLSTVKTILQICLCFDKQTKHKNV